MRSWKEADRTCYELKGPAVADWHVNEFLYEDGAAGHRGHGARKLKDGTATLELVRDFRSERHSVWGITARNREQNFALNLLHGSGDRLRHDPRARPAPARPCWRWRPDWCRRSSAIATPKSS